MYIYTYIVLVIYIYIHMHDVIYIIDLCQCLCLNIYTQLLNLSKHMATSRSYKTRCAFLLYTELTPMNIKRLFMLF